jgi:aspartyl-tRNA(Asn)/glutamyl-tRNA(Gln) amidotransferase subunit B
VTAYPHEVIIGLEVHVQLSTESKLFCGCGTKFGAAPNTQTCPVCTGLPGALPVLNRKAYELGVRAGAALDCEIAKFTKWDRKNYFYPDLPKAYQISQFDLPITLNGHLTISDPKGAFENRRIGITRAHLEEDAGKSMHDEAAGKGDSRIDLNRCGTPLLEIVSEPDLRSALESKIYLTELKLILTYLGVSDCNMQEGSLRVDANINLHIETPEGKIATPIVEVKNMNSFRAVEHALEYEAVRQYDEWEETGHKIGDFPKQTYGWDEHAQVTRPQRFKEESSDYRYFPDPDLLPVTVDDAFIASVHEGLGELPAALRERLQKTYKIKAYDADVLVNQGRALVDYFIEAADLSGNVKMASNWIQQDVLRTLNEQKIGIKEFPVSASNLGELLKRVGSGKIPANRGREVFALMIDETKSLDDAVETLGIEEVDSSELETLCQTLLDENPRVVEEVKAGKMKAVGSLIGKAKQKNPNVSPNEVREICLRLIEGM